MSQLDPQPSSTHHQLSTLHPSSAGKQPNTFFHMAFPKTSQEEDIQVSVIDRPNPELFTPMSFGPLLEGQSSHQPDHGNLEFTYDERYVPPHQTTQGLVPHH